MLDYIWLWIAILEWLPACERVSLMLNINWWYVILFWSQHLSIVCPFFLGMSGVSVINYGINVKIILSAMNLRMIWSFTEDSLFGRFRILVCKICLYDSFDWVSLHFSWAYKSRFNFSNLRDWNLVLYVLPSKILIGFENRILIEAILCFNVIIWV